METYTNPKMKGPKVFGYSILHPLNLILFFNIGIYVLQLFSIDPSNGSSLIEQVFALRPKFFLSGMYWQIFTYGFLHATHGSTAFFHIFLNMYGFILLGKHIEPILGKVKFALLYFGAQLFGGLFIVLNTVILNWIGELNIISSYYGNGLILPNGNFINFDIIPTYGASGAVFGILTVFGLLYPNIDFYPFFVSFLKVKSRYIVLVSLLFGYFLEKLGGVLISNSGHLGGAVGGYLFYLVFIRPNLSKIILPTPSNESTNYITQESLNLRIKKDVENLKSQFMKELFLAKLQPEDDVNLCPPATFQLEDKFCLSCEWYTNCFLRKLQNENKNSTGSDEVV